MSMNPIDLRQFPAMCLRRPWILGAQMGMSVALRGLGRRSYAVAAAVNGVFLRQVGLGTTALLTAAVSLLVFSSLWWWLYIESRFRSYPNRYSPCIPAT